MNKRNIIIGTILVAVLLVGGFYLTRSGQTAEITQTGETVTVERGNLASNATATGQIVAQREASLALGQSGVVETIFVSEGDLVQVGDPLLTIEQDGLARDVASAVEAVAIAEADLANLLAEASAAELAAAEADVASAAANLQQLLDGPTAEELAILEGSLEAAEANVWAMSAALNNAQEGASEAEIAAAEAQYVSAQLSQSSLQDNYEKLLECFTFETPVGEERTICPGLGDPEESTRYQLESANASLAAAQATLNELQEGPDPNSVAIAQANLAAATARRDAAQINLEIALLPPTAAEVAQAEQQLAQAEAALAQLQRGATETAVTQAEVAVEQAKIRLAQAEQALTDATLVAPFSGVIADILINEGEQVSGIVMEMVDIDSLEVVLDVDEIDVGDIAEGQTAVVTLEAYPEVSIEAEVAAIAPSNTPNSSSNIVTYEVNLSLSEADVPLRVNMTANASLLTATREDTLLAPNEAITVDRESGTYSVTVVEGSGDSRTLETVQVSVGLRDGQYTEILAGVGEGDVLLIGNLIPIRQVAPGPNGDNGGPFGG